MHMRENYSTVIFCRYGDFVAKIIIGLVYWPEGSASVVQYAREIDELRSFSFNPLDWCTPSVEAVASELEPLTSEGIHYLIKGKNVTDFHQLTVRSTVAFPIK